MRIAYIATGAAGMVCGTCIHDNTLAAALTKQGHEVALIPTYTPIRTDEEDVSLDRVFLGGVNVYLQEKFSLFRHTPAFIDNLLNSKALLRWVSRFSASTDATELGRMTVSVLNGESGHQRKELMKLVQWLRDEYKPDIVQLNHSLILGFAREIKRQLNVPVVCGLQGEDLFIDELIEPYRSQVMTLLQEKVADVDAMIATSDYYADFMARYLGAPRDKIHTIHLGIKLEGHGMAPAVKRNQIAIGYFARICPEKGLHLLVDAFHKLWQHHGDKIALKLAGYLGPKDQAFYADLEAKIKSLGMHEAVEYVGEVDRLGKIAFLSSIDIFSVPAVYQESKGLYILEAMLNGTPVVQPKHGLFPEVIDKTSGGILVQPKSVDALVEGLNQLINDAELRKKLGENGKQAVRRSFSDASMARATLAFYEKFLQRASAKPVAIDSTPG